MRIAFEKDGMFCIEEFNSFFSLYTVDVPKTMHPDETEKVCKEAVFRDDVNNKKLYIVFKTPREYYGKIPALSISYGHLLRYVLKNGYFDFTRKTVEVDDFTFVLDCEVEYR